MVSDAVKRWPSIGFIGLGEMGGRMARNLIGAGYPLIAFDINAERLAACASAGATAADSAADAVKRSEVVMTSLRSSEIFVEVAENHLLPHAREGQMFIDLGTTVAPETRRLAAGFAAKGAALVDAPVSGGPQGAAQGNLRMFVGGDAQVVARCRPILEVLGEPERIVYCGPSGAGQVVKGVNQLAMGLGDAAYMEAIAFGVRAGVSLEAIEKAVGGGGGHWREHFSAIARQIIRGKGGTMVVKFPELPYFLEEAEEQGFEIPLTQALYAFLKTSEHFMLDNMNRPSRSFWLTLMTKGMDSDLDTSTTGT
ncbi:NAD(P)-dependent oxidoreductase [Candidatus Poribacteria bacterium]|nr:NAD(P)-dependent oxidoreductase [Candidatus Poribacteria bacterium]